MTGQSEGIRISLVTPLYKSEAYIDELYKRSVAAIRTVTDNYEIIFVNDASPDGSLAVAKRIARQDERVIVVDLARNFGQHKALLTGIQVATGDYVYICDSDLEEEPEWLADFYRTLQAENCDVIYGVQQKKKGSLFYRIASHTFYKSIRYLSNSDFPENLVTARMMSRRYINAMLEYREREIFLAGIWHMVGFRQIPFQVRKLDTSPTTYKTSQLIGLFVNAVTAFSNRPLQIISVAGLILCLLALLLILYLIYAKLVYGIEAEGWTSVMAGMLLIGGISVFFNGIIAIYVAKIFIEVKQRPLTSIREIYCEGRNINDHPLPLPNHQPDREEVKQ
jgi:putative glycosyltransferase